MKEFEEWLENYKADYGEGLPDFIIPALRACCRDGWNGALEVVFMQWRDCENCPSAFGDIIQDLKVKS